MRPVSGRAPRGRLRGAFGTLAVSLSLLGLLPAGAGAVEVKNHEPLGTLVGGKVIENPCGLAVTSVGDVLVSDYHHDEIGRWSPLPFPNYSTLIPTVDPPSGPCGLALDAADNLYVNYFHGAVVRYAAPAYAAPAVIDPGPATGVALDKATGELFVDERTQIARYAAPVSPGPPTAVIGAGSLADGFGLAVSEATGELYVADAASHTVKAFDPAAPQPNVPVAEIDAAGSAAGRFVSLHDAGLAIDQSSGDLFVADDTQPGFEHPHAAIDEFNAAGLSRGQLASVLTSGAPVGIAVDQAGKVYVTSGNGQSDALGGFDPEQASAVRVFGPAGVGRLLTASVSGAGQGRVTSTPAGIACPGACEAELNSGATATLTATAAPGSVFAGWSGACAGTGSCQVTLTATTSVEAGFLPAPPSSALRAASPGTSAGVSGSASAPGPGRLELGRPIGRGAVVTVTVTAPGPGFLTATGPALRPATLRFAAAGPARLRLRLSRAAAISLRRSGRPRMTVARATAFRPRDGGLPVTGREKVTFRRTAWGNG